jgi:phosphatidylglycerophosphate synthase
MEGIAIYPSSSGKIKTALQLIGISCVLFNIAVERIDAIAHQIGLIIIYAALFFSIYSAVNYLTALFRPSGLKS